MCKKALTYLAIFAAIALWFPFSQFSAGSGQSVHHDLKIILHPSDNTLSGLDTLTLDARDVPDLTLLLSQTASVHNVSPSGKNSAFTFKNGQLLIPLESNDRKGLLTLSIDYSASFRDPVPDTFANTDNPGYGVTGIISSLPPCVLCAVSCRWYYNRACVRVRVASE